MAVLLVGNSEFYNKYQVKLRSLANKVPGYFFTAYELGANRPTMILSQPDFK